MEFLSEKNIVASPSVIAANIDYTGEYISRRCRKLTQAELLQRIDASNYRITDFGEQFLRGEVEATELELKDGSSET